MSGGALAGAALLVAAALVQLRGLRAVRAVDRREVVPWWHGYARDAVNLAAAGLAFAGLRVSGYPGPGCLLLALCVALAVYGVDAATASGSAPSVASGTRRAFGVAMTLVVAVVAALALARPLVWQHLGPALEGLRPAGADSQKSSTLPASIDCWRTDERGSVA